jgi:hypothetical protein
VGSDQRQRRQRVPAGALRLLRPAVRVRRIRFGSQKEPGSLASDEPPRFQRNLCQWAPANLAIVDLQTVMIRTEKLGQTPRSSFPRTATTPGPIAQRDTRRTHVRRLKIPYRNRETADGPPTNADQTIPI